MRRCVPALVVAIALSGLAVGDVAASVEPAEPSGPTEPSGPSGPVDVVGDGPTPGAVGSPERRPFVEVPAGCLAQPLPDVVFVGTLVDRDFRTARFRIGQVRAGDPAPFAGDGLIDVRYGNDVKFLDAGERYLVSARRDPVLGVLASRIRPEPPMFGGDDIVGMVDAEVECPGFEDPARTLFPDGSAVESSVVGPLFDRRSQLAGAVLLPVAVAFGLVFVLASLRLSIGGLLRGLGSAARSGRRRLS